MNPRRRRGKHRSLACPLTTSSKSWLMVSFCRLTTSPLTIGGTLKLASEPLNAPSVNQRIDAATEAGERIEAERDSRPRRGQRAVAQFHKIGLAN